MGQPRDRGRQRLTDRELGFGVAVRLELMQQLEHAGTALCGVIQANVEVGDAPEPQPPAKLAPHERHRPAEGRDGCVAFGGLTDDAHPDLRMTQVRRGLHVRDRDKADPGIAHLPVDDLRDLLPQQHVELFGPFAHSDCPVGPLQAVATRLTVCEVKHSMMSPSSRSWKPASPMPHS